MNLSNLKTAQSLINHLIKWGELTRFEATADEGYWDGAE